MISSIEDRTIRKPFLGGWQNSNGVEYLNADSQTGPPTRQAPETCSRMVQFIEVKDAVVQAPRDRATQMNRPDCFISSETDKYKTPKPYETYEEMSLRLDFDGKARVIQRNYRAYIIRKSIKEWARQYREILDNCRKYQEEKLTMRRKRHEQEIIRRIYPETRADFDMLYELIEKWRRDRLGHTKQNFFWAARCAENYLILDKTVEMFNTIDQKRQMVRDRWKRKNRVNFLTVNCEPIRWNGYKGKRIEMVTMKIQRAREFKSIYDSLADNNATREERVEFLIMLKKSMEIHTCVAAFKLIRLLDQELSLLARGIDGSALENFRERILIHYLFLVRASHDCECENIKQDPCKYLAEEKLREPLESKTKLCRSCSKLLPHYRFAVHGRMKNLSTCITCSWLRERNFGHVSYDPYAFLLNCTRADERRRHCSSAIAFMMQTRDMYHLVNTIWHGCSAVSKCTDVLALRMVRYNVGEEWSPWNCILLTEDEAEVHYRIEDPSTVYARPLVTQILLSHQLARNHFKDLSMYEKDFRESCRFYKIQDRKDYKPAEKLDQYYFI